MISSSNAKNYKVCKCCGKLLPVSDFGRNIYAKDRMSYSCKKCMNKRRAEIIAEKRVKVLAQQREAMKVIKMKNIELGIGNYDETVSTSEKTQQGVKASFKLSDFDDSHLFAELRRRGYEGELKYYKKVVI